MTTETRVGRKPKFRVGQVVRVMGSDKFRSYLPDYFRVSAIRRDDGKDFYCVSDHDTRGPWLAEKQLRALTKREVGR